MRRIVGRAMKFAIRPTLARIPGRWTAHQQADALDDVERFLVFVGAPRSGHTLVGALLDAHPEARIAHELDVLRAVAVRAGRRSILGNVLRRHRWFAARDRRWTGYDYRVPGQDTVRRLRVLGDKAGGMTTAWLLHDAHLLDRLQDTLQLPVHVVHHIRHPLDNLATIVRRDGIGLDAALDRLEHQLDVLVPLLARWEAVHTHHEDLTVDPVGPLQAIAHDLQLDAPTAWLEAARQVVRPASRTRDNVAWSDPQQARLDALLAPVPWLRRYRS